MSRLGITYYCIKKEILRKGNKATPHIGVKGLNNIPNISKKEQKPIINLVDKILKLKTENKDTTDLENKIDEIVFDLYGLSEEEISYINRK